MGFWTPERDWEGQDAYIIGGGASLRHFDLSVLKGRHTIGCNDAFRLGEELVEICMFGDASWWHKTKFDLSKFKNPVVHCAPSLSQHDMVGLNAMKRNRVGISTGHSVGWNYSTGGAAVNLAISKGAKRVFLLGIDMCLIDNKSHWHDLRQGPTRTQVFERFRKGFKHIADELGRFGVEVVHVMEGPSVMDFFTVMNREQFKETLAQTREVEYV